MSDGIIALLAALPIFTILILMVGLRWPATKAMPLAFFVTALLALFVWKTPLTWVLASGLNGVIIGLTIVLIVFGALALLFTLRESGALEVINRGFSYISPDRRIQTIIIAFLFGAFLEASAGFGAPIALVAPLLLSIGFPPMAAVMVSLVANSTPVSFGTVGTPTIIGIGTSLNTPSVLNAISEHGMSFSEMIHKIGVWTAVQHALPGILMPLVIVVLLTRFFGERKSIREGLEIWPYAIFAGLCFIVPFLIVAILLGPEFPCLIGALLGLFILIPLTKAGFLVPKKVWEFPERKNWDKNWSGLISMEMKISDNKISPLKAWLPYLLIGLLLVVARVSFLPVNTWLKSIKLVSPLLFNTTLKAEFEPFTNAGIMPFLFIALLCIPLYGMNVKKVSIAWRSALKGVKNPLIALLFTVPMVRIMIQSGTNPHGYLSMPVAMAQYVSQLFHGAWPLVDSTVGALGAFIAGSNTVSNMLFSLFQYSIADHLGISHIITVSLQNVGGALGNLINVQKVITGCAAVGLTGLEGLIIKRNLVPLLFFLIITGVIGLILVYVLVPGLF
jgi:lactate permease